MNSDGLQLIAEFDSHKLTSQLVCPNDAVAVYIVEENPSPTNVILVAPVVGVFIQRSGGIFFIFWPATDIKLSHNASSKS
jgi:hypothetical protein